VLLDPDCEFNAGIMKQRAGGPMGYSVPDFKPSSRMAAPDNTRGASRKGRQPTQVLPPIVRCAKLLSQLSDTLAFYDDRSA